MDESKLMFDTPRKSSAALARLAAVVLVVSFAGVVGCESTPLGTRSDDDQPLTEPPGTGLVARQRPLIPDVPMPVGFVAIPARSSSFVTPEGARVVNHTYQGLASVRDGVTFYRQNLAINGWQPVREHSDASRTHMVYVKGREELTVEVNHPRVLDVVVRIRDRQTGATAGVYR